MEQQIELHINAWLLVSFCAAGVGISIWSIYHLLLKLAELVIQGIRTDITHCQKELTGAIDSVRVLATTANSNALSAHSRLSKLETAIIRGGLVPKKE